MKDNSKPRRREVRTTPCHFAIREAEGGDGTKEESRTIEGTAIVFNKESRVLDEDWNPFVEVIAPSACRADWLKTQDVKLNLLHDRNATIGRCDHGEGNLRLSVDTEGVKFEIDVPRCDIGDRALALVRAGVYSGCSFEFMPKDYKTEKIKDADGNELPKVTETAFEYLSALTIGMDPAYTETQVNARELQASPNPLKEEGEDTPQASGDAREAARERAHAAALGRAAWMAIHNS